MRKATIKYVNLTAIFLLFCVGGMSVLGIQDSENYNKSLAYQQLSLNGKNAPANKKERVGLPAHYASAGIEKNGGILQQLVKFSFLNIRIDTVKPPTGQYIFHSNSAIIPDGIPHFRQKGFKNMLIQKQDQLSYNNRFIKQSGQFNYAEQITDHSLFSEVLISSAGTANTAFQNVYGFSFGKTSIVQSGLLNYAEQNVNFYNKSSETPFIRSYIKQTGYSNFYESYQLRENSRDSTIQKGSHNRVEIYQRGKGNKVFVKQNGSNNKVHISQN